MDQVLYDLMDWAGIEEIVYSEAANPERLLGAHEVEEGLLIQVFMPHAVAVAAKVGNVFWRLLTITGQRRNCRIHTHSRLSLQTQS